MSSFTIKIYRGGTTSPSSVEFHTTASPRVIDLSHELNDWDREFHSQFVDKGATHAIEVQLDDKLDHLYLFKTDVMYMESPQGETIFSVTRSKRPK